MKLTAIIIDDEEGSRNNLQFLLTNYCPEVKVTGMATDVNSGLSLIAQQQPDIVFLDIEMPEQDGFQLIEQLEENLSPKIVFTTAYAKYAIQAFKVAATDYLLKPIDIEELKNTIDRIKTANLATKHKPVDGPKKMVISHQNGLTFLEENEIICLEANRNYTKIHISNGKTLLVAKTLGDFEELLVNSSLFFRTHRSFIINLNHLIQLVNKDGGYLLMNNDLKVPLSRNRKESFLERVQHI